MKRYLPAIIIFFLILSGYYLVQTHSVQGPDSAQAEENDHPKEATATGVISSLGSVSVPGSGTHLLTKPDHTTILLTGLGANLDNYLGATVEVDGRLSQTASGKELIQVLHVTPLKTVDTGVAGEDPTKWDVFQETVNFGVTFKRRHGWTLAETKTLLTFAIAGEHLEDKSDTITLERVANLKNDPLQNFTGDPKTSTKNLIGPHKLVGYKRVDNGVVTFVVAREQFVFILRYTPGLVRGVDPSANDFFTLISSFDFVPLSAAKAAVTAKK